MHLPRRSLFGFSLLGAFFGFSSVEATALEDKEKTENEEGTLQEQLRELQDLFDNFVHRTKVEQRRYPGCRSLTRQ